MKHAAMTYNDLCEVMQLIPPDAPNAGGNNFRLELFVNGEVTLLRINEAMVRSYTIFAILRNTCIIIRNTLMSFIMK